jgi:hypothetical protein
VTKPEFFRGTTSISAVALTLNPPPSDAFKAAWEAFDWHAAGFATAPKLSGSTVVLDDPEIGPIFETGDYEQLVYAFGTVVEAILDIDRVLAPA